MHPIPPHEVRTPPPRLHGDPGISRPCFCGPRSPIHEWARSGPRRRPTIWGTWPPSLSPPYCPTALGPAPRPQEPAAAVPAQLDPRTGGVEALEQRAAFVRGHVLLSRRDQRV